MTANSQRIRRLVDYLDGQPRWLLRLEDALRQLDPHAAQVIRNRLRKSYHGPKERCFDPGRFHDSDSVESVLGRSFIWEYTPEGKPYWHRLSTRLAGRTRWPKP